MRCDLAIHVCLPRPPASGAEVADQWPLELAMGRPRPVRGTAVTVRLGSSDVVSSHSAPGRWRPRCPCERGRVTFSRGRESPLRLQAAVGGEAVCQLMSPGSVHASASRAMCRHVKRVPTQRAGSASPSCVLRLPLPRNDVAAERCSLGFGPCFFFLKKKTLQNVKH